jgi:acyl-coenzyme A synthetase/AMP-(fatty) acid ligase
MTAGYLDPADNEGRFLERDTRTWYRTGDRVRLLANGELIYLGRLDSQVQLNGWRVELAEIEHALRGCADVQDAVAVTRSTDDGPQLAVFYTGAPSSAVALTRQLREILPKGMMPKHYQYVEEFPLNANRKIDRARLADEAAGLFG